MGVGGVCDEVRASRLEPAWVLLGSQRGESSFLRFFILRGKNRAGDLVRSTGLCRRKREKRSWMVHHRLAAVATASLPKALVTRPTKVSLRR
jgi:hypothetical protein